MMTKVFAFLLSAYALFSSVAFAQTNEPDEVRMDGRFRRDVTQVLPVTLYDLHEAVTPDSPENMARQFLRNSSKKILGRLEDAVNELQFVGVQETAVSRTVHLKQVVNGIPVFNSDISVTFNRNNEVVFYTGSFEPNLKASAVPANLPDLGLGAAKAYLKAKVDPDFYEAHPVWFVRGGTTYLAQEVVVSNRLPQYEWKFVVDATTGDVLFADSQSLQCHENEKGVLAEQNEPDKFVSSEHIQDVLPKNIAIDTETRQIQVLDGTANVFDPDPLSSAHAKYGDTGYTDNNDADSDQLHAQLKQVTLKDISFDGTNYRLKGKYVEIGDYDSPFKGLFEQSTSDFRFNRSDDAFEAVMAYYHLDKSMRYINETLGIPVVPFQNNGKVIFDPSAESGRDNSHFSPALGLLYYGEGGVDDAEDADVIWHEFGHGIHTWVTNGGFTNTEGLSEGFSDYWAQSYSRSLNNWQPSESDYQRLYQWDGNFAPFFGRITNSTSKYPEGLTASNIYLSGQIFSTTMMKVWDVIGRSNTDKMAVIGMSMTNNNANQNDAINAIYQAAKLLGLSSTQIQAIYTIFSNAGYTMPAQVLGISLTADKRNANSDESITYTVKIDNDAPSQKSNVVVSNPIPSGTTYVNGSATCNGAFDGLKLTFTLGTMEGGQAQICTFKVQINPTQTTMYIWDDVEKGESKWVKTHDSANFDWRIRNSNSFNSVSSWFATDLSIPSEQILTLAQATPSLEGTPQLNFWQRIESEEYDGGVVEVSTDVGVTWIDLAPYFTLNGYNYTIPDNPLFGSKIAGRKAFAGVSHDASTGGYINTVADLSAFLGKNVVVRFRYVTDGSGSVFGWSLDNIFIANASTITDQACVTSSQGDNKCAVFKNFVISVDNEAAQDVPSTFALSEAYPNPFNPEASFTLTVANSQKVKIEVIDMLGRTISTLHDGYMAAQQPQTFKLDGSAWKSGVYFYRVLGENFVETKKVVLMK
jgi:uncharacterized repeat protein (TIGR01451 family)